MPPDYLHNFIAASPPDIGDIRDIAENDEAKNSQWYRKLSVPYLVQALSTGKDQATKKLNARRAQAVMKQSTSTSEVFRDQTARLYSHEWQKKFPLMSQFLADQQANAASHNPAIVADAEQWIAEIEQGLNKSTDPDEQQQLQQMVSIAENACDTGKSGKYWAYIFFQYLTSPNYLTMLRIQLLDGNTSQNLSQDIQHYSAILSILDPTSFFTRLFVQVVGIFQLTSLLPSLLDVPGNLDQFTFFMQKVLEAFMEKYIDSQDPQMAKQAKDVPEGLKVTSIMVFFASAAATVNSNTWQDIVAKFESQAIAKLGPVVSALANISLLGAVAFGIVNLANGTISFDELKPEQQALFISQSVNVVVLFSRKGIRSGMAYQATGSLWEAMKVFFEKEITSSQVAISSVFGRWIVRNSKTPRPSDLQILFGEVVDHAAQFEAQYPRLTKVFGRNLEEFMATRFSAAMAVVGIVSSGIALGNSETPLETAMNSLFLASATLELVAVAARWAVSAIRGACSFVRMLSVAGYLGIAAAVAGVIILIIIINKTIQDPIETFVNSADVKNGGFFMEYETAIDYSI